MREETIRWLDSLKKTIGQPQHQALWHYAEAIDMAIKALSTNLSDDLISRADAIEALGEEPEIWTDTDEEWAYHNAWVEHISALKALPSIEVKLAQAEKCEECIHHDTHKDKMTCKECVSAEAVQGEWQRVF